MRNNVAFSTNDVVLSLVHSVRQQTIAYQRFCDIDVDVAAVDRTREDIPEGMEPPTVNVEARFTRDYTQGKLPDWVITKFRVNIAWARGPRPSE